MTNTTKTPIYYDAVIVYRTKQDYTEACKYLCKYHTKNICTLNLKTRMVSSNFQRVINNVKKECTITVICEQGTCVVSIGDKEVDRRSYVVNEYASTSDKSLAV